MRQELIGRAHLADAFGVGVAEEDIRRKRNGVSQFAAEQRMNWQVERLSHDVKAGEFERRQQLQAVVIERRCRVRNLPAQGLERKGVMPEEIRRQARDGGLGAFAAAAHLAEPANPLIGIHLDDRAYEAAPVRPGCVAQGRREGHRDSGRTHAGDAKRLHSNKSGSFACFSSMKRSTSRRWARIRVSALSGLPARTASAIAACCLMSKARLPGSGRLR